MTATTLSGYAERIASVRERIAIACARSDRDPATVTLLAVSKTQSSAAVMETIAFGIQDFGENRVQEALEKQSQVGPGATWHLVGHLQTNKAKAAAGRFAILHGIDSERVLIAVAQAATKVQRIMIEVNIGGEETKFGFTPSQLLPIVALARTLPNIRLEGLMTVAPRHLDVEQVRPHFAGLRRLAHDSGLGSLSMGMTDDFEVAIEEGATHIRIGRAIFGERQV